LKLMNLQNRILQMQYHSS